jgi:hypothetical protein
MAMEALQREGFALPRPWQQALSEYVRTILPRVMSAQSER